MVETGGQRLTGVFQTFERTGWLELLFPFLLLFAFFFAVLQKSKIFKDSSDNPNTRLNGVFAFAISLLIVIPHMLNQYPAGRDPITIINQILPSTAVMLVSIVVVLILLGLVGFKQGERPLIQTIAALVGVVVIIVAAMAAMDVRLGQYLGPLGDSNIQALVIALLVMGIIVFFITRPAGGTGGAARTKETLEALLHGPKSSGGGSGGGD